MRIGTAVDGTSDMYMLTVVCALRDEEVARFLNVLTGRAPEERDKDVSV